MSSKSSKKAASGPRIPPPEPIITRTKSAQQKQERRHAKSKSKKTEKPKLTKPERKSTKPTKKVICTKGSLLVEPTKKPVEVLEQEEYYPNKLKRDICTKKIMLKPKHNFKVIAATNKRKLAIPQRGLKSPFSKSQSLLKSPIELGIARSCSPELSMQEMVRIIEETRSLSDEDFMEILTCPSPVWWEDPPDGRYNEDAIYTRSPDPPLEETSKETKKRKIASNTPQTKTIIENKTEQNSLKINKKDEKFVKKKEKLENVLGNIKNRTLQPKNGPKNNLNIDRNRKLSDSEGDISDLSFNEEEILKNLENMDIPVEKSHENIKDNVEIEQEVNEVNVKNELIIEYITETASKNERNFSPNIISVKSEAKDDFSVKNSNSCVTSPTTCSQSSNLDQNRSYTDKNNDSLVNSCTNTLVKNESLNSDIKQEKTENDSGTVKNDEVVNKKTNDLSEFITVYKIIPEKSNVETKPENDANQVENSACKIAAGKLNNFFKQCKSNKRLKKEQIVPASSLTDVKETIGNKKEIIDSKTNLENSDAKTDDNLQNNRLKCEYCVIKAESDEKDFSCGKCKVAPYLICDLCNFFSDKKEFRRLSSTYTDVARISWNPNYVLNQT